MEYYQKSACTGAPVAVMCRRLLPAWCPHPPPGATAASWLDLTGCWRGTSLPRRTSAPLGSCLDKVYILKARPMVTEAKIRDWYQKQGPGPGPSCDSSRSYKTIEDLQEKIFSGPPLRTAGLSRRPTTPAWPQRTSGPSLRQKALRMRLEGAIKVRRCGTS